jgi:release factor glutamine methyltransferase
MTEAQTLRATVRRIETRLRDAGVETPGLDAKLLVGAALDLSRARLLIQADRVLDVEELRCIDTLVSRRATREPVSRILGRREFWSLDFALDAATLDPRPDSETIVDAALSLFPDRGAAPAVLDLGTGTGCLLLAILAERPNATGLGIDRAEAAVAAARANADRLGLGDRARFAVGDWGHGLIERFDLVVSNPPYIPDADIDGLDPEVACFDPRLALAGGADGLDAYRTIVPQLRNLLHPRGFVVFEVGAGQAEDVARLLSSHGLTGLGTRRDLSGVERAVLGQLGG